MLILFATFLLIIRIIIGILNKKKKCYKKFELEIIDKRTEKNDIGFGQNATLTYDYYTARYWDNEEKIIEFKNLQDGHHSKIYSVGEKFYGYISPDGKKVEHEDVHNMSPRLLTIVIIILYLFGFLGIFGSYLLTFIMNSFEQKSLSSTPTITPVLSSVLSNIIFLSPISLIGIGVIIVGIVFLIKRKKFIDKKNNCYFKQIYSTIVDIKQERKSKKHGYYFYYRPILTYELNGEIKTYCPSSGSKTPNFIKGDTYILYLDPVTGNVLEDKDKSYKIIGIACIAIGVFTLFNTLLPMLMMLSLQ